MKISDRLREYAKAYREPPTGREVEGTVEVWRKQRNTLID